jgi:hypothetical protein
MYITGIWKDSDEGSIWPNETLSNMGFIICSFIRLGWGQADIWDI